MALSCNMLIQSLIICSIATLRSANAGRFAKYTYMQYSASSTFRFVNLLAEMTILVTNFMKQINDEVHVYPPHGVRVPQFHLGEHTDETKSALCSILHVFCQ